MLNSGVTVFIPELLYMGGRFERGRVLVCDESGTVVAAPRLEIPDGFGAGENSFIEAEPGIGVRVGRIVRLRGRAMLPGLVNAHSHAFQRVIRGRTEYRSANAEDSFWTWREMMYAASARLTPEDIYDASRMAFLEMALGGITAVGEFHYLHNAPAGRSYDDPNLLAKEVVRAAGEVGLRIALLRVAYARSGFQTDPNPKQARFIERDLEVYLKNVESLVSVRSPTVREGQPANDALPDGRASETAWIGVAPHSVRAVPLDYLRQVIDYANLHDLKIHMHVAEQPAEVSACIEEYGRTPVALLESEGLLSERFTAVHAIHVTPKAIPSFAKSGAMVCACPTTERNLGDGVVPADEYCKHGVPMCLGTDSHAQIDLLEAARELEYHLRLQKLERAVLSVRSPTVREGLSSDQGALPHGRASDTAALLFDCATINGARSIGAPSGALETGMPGTFLPSISMILRLPAPRRTICFQALSLARRARPCARS